MMKYISTLIVALTTLCAAAVVWADKPSEGYIVTPDKFRIFYKIVGTGTETLVVVHGGPGNSLESIRADFEPLAKGRRVIYYDQRGNGRSDLIGDGKKLGYEYHVADLEALRKHFKLEKMALFGNSWGGMLISLYAVAHPDRVERLVLDSAAPPTRGLHVDMNDEISDRMNALYTPDQLSRAKSLWEPENWRKATDPAAICREFYTLVLTVYTYGRRLDNIGFKGDVCFGSKEAIRMQQTVNRQIWASLGDYNLIPKLGVVKAPVLVIHGVADVIPRRASEFWAAGYPNARLLLIEKAGHMGHVETPEIFFPAVETFLKGSFPDSAKKVYPPVRK
jgi:proline iminopeptidase